MAAFALGSTDTNVCPNRFFRLDNQEACERAAAVGGATFGGSAKSPGLPSGCYWNTVSGSVSLNTLVDGAGNYYAQPLCAGAPGPDPGVCSTASAGV